MRTPSPRSTSRRIPALVSAALGLSLLAASWPAASRLAASWMGRGRQAAEPAGATAGASTAASPPAGGAALPLRFQRGMVIETEIGEHADPAGPATLRELAALGVDAIQVVPFAIQPDIERPELRFPDFTAPQTAFIREAHALGLAVLLKPHIWSDQFWGPEPRWHGDLRMQTEADWQSWFAGYREFILHYARLAETTGAEILCVGLEYVQATRERPEDWRRLIAAVRGEYHGLLTYGANLHGEAADITFWDALDYIGVNAYPSLARRGGATVAEMLAGYAPTVELLARLAAEHDRPVLITEIGFSSTHAAAVAPWKWPGRGDWIDSEEQARAYEATFRALWPEPWVAGIYFWKWPIDGRGGGPGDTEYTPRGKPAAEILARYYRAPRAMARGAGAVPEGPGRDNP